MVQLNKLLSETAIFQGETDKTGNDFYEKNNSPLILRKFNGQHIFCIDRISIRIFRRFPERHVID